jgi:hypothetical protein
MGADLLIVSLVIDKAREPDFDAGHEAIENLASIDVEAPDEFFEYDCDNDEGMTEIRRQLADALEELRCGLVSREVEWIELRGARVYVTGGMSWGDTPTHLFETIVRLRAVRGVLTAVGFEGESR